MSELRKRTAGYVLAAALLAGVFSAGAFAAEDLLGVYNRIEAASAKNTPVAYTVIVENKRFAEALKELPKEVLTGKGDPAVSVRFKKGEGVKIVILNVKSEYASLFSMYEDYLRFSGISKVQNPAELKEVIDKGKVELQNGDKNYIVLKAWDPTKEEKDDNYALFYLDRTTWVIKKAVYFLDGEPYVQADNSYKEYGRYYLPNKIVLTYSKENSTDVFLFKNYKF